MSVTVKTVTAALSTTKSVNVDKRPIVDDLVRLINRFHDDGKRPLYVYCNSTGRKCGMTAKSYFESKVKQFGSIENLMFEYKGKRGGSPKPKIIKGRTVLPAPREPVDDVCSYLISSRKGDVFRTELSLAGKIHTSYDFDVTTGIKKFIKGGPGPEQHKKPHKSYYVSAATKRANKLLKQVDKS